MQCDLYKGQKEKKELDCRKNQQVGNVHEMQPAVEIESRDLKLLSEDITYIIQSTSCKNLLD